MAQLGSLNISTYDEFSKKSVHAKIKIQNSDNFLATGNMEISEIALGIYTFKVSPGNYITVF
ncbi:hypothetical protein CMU59_18240 [Elizabethkingia anophelis]|nr:hypothetical protein [Elizabethkingia anophelis]MDV3601316.1 hypothetical protein [Elizabethkingia anophelis]MDV3608619.1 hypothetical protein [Elizabethkingia anophelis]MDV3640585.1 hypothetical protein [Elizabethkingia anophelis]MDV3651337.1 hypothetical protein [Elizabethkingia anophelis]